MAFLHLANVILVLHLISVHVYADSPPPTQPPVQSPTSPPVKPPTMHPVKPPTFPPVKPPTQPPVKPPTSYPVQQPTLPPVDQPQMPPRMYGVAVQGVVFCRSICNYRGQYNKVTRTALQGAAVVKLVCKTDSEKDGGNFMRKVETDESGNFTLKTSRIKADDGAKSCKMFLVRSRDRECNFPTPLNGGSTGATLTLAVGGKKLEGRYSVFNVGPFAFEPVNKTKPCDD